MALDPALPPSLAAKINDLERRLANLERSPRLTTASVTDRLRVVDSSGDQVGVLGLLSDGSWGILVEETLTGNQHDVLKVTGHGVIHPWIYTSWAMNVSGVPTISVTSGTFIEVARSFYELVITEEMLFRVDVSVPVGTTAELRVTALNGTVVSGTKSITGTGSFAYAECRWAHGIDLHEGPVIFRLEARRSAGAGTITMFAPGNIAHGGAIGPVVGDWV